MTEASRWGTLRGIDAPPPQRVGLAAGPVRAVLDGVDLREVRLAGSSQTLIDRVYVAVRDRDWDTIPGRISDLVVETSDHRFDVSFSARHRSADIDFTWDGRIVGHPDGHIECTMSGVAHQAFDYCRIGFCVLHPDTLAGAAYAARTADGPIEGVLPLLITPQTIVDGVEQALFPAFDDLTIRTADEVSVRTSFTGDLFETEDQRNWTDASFKTYGTPIALGYPHRAEPGQRFAQSVTIAIAGEAESAPVDASADVVSLTLGDTTGRSFPFVGLGISSAGDPLSDREVALLRALRLDHLRVDVRPARPGWEARLDEAARQAQALGCGLELALFVPSASSGGEPRSLAAARAVAQRVRDVPIARVIVFDEATAGTGVTPAALATEVRAGLAEVGSGAPIVGGTDGDFAELNRAREGLESFEGLAYAVNPQVHASDDRSILENVTAQGASVATARSFAGGRTVHVSSVTIAPRFNPAAAAPDPSDGPDIAGTTELPRAVDPRQTSLLGAAWTVGSMAALARADSVTWYETVGWRGLIERASGSRLASCFLSVPGMTYPMYHAFADLAELREGELLDLASSAPRLVTGLAVRRGARVNGLLANLTPSDVPISVRPLGLEVRYRLLDASTADLATSDPDAFRRSGAAQASVDGELRLTLPPYAVLVFGAAPAVPT